MVALYKNCLNMYKIQFKVPKLIVGDLNFGDIRWHQNHGDGVNTVCSELFDNELKFVNAVIDNLFLLH